MRIHQSLAAMIVAGLTIAPSAQVVAQDAHEREEHEDIVRLSPAEIQEFGIELSTSGPETIVTILSIPGEVQPNADRLAHIVPRYSGIVTGVNVSVGDRVRQGQTLAVVEGDESLAPFDVITLLSGTVIEKHITLGEAVGREGSAFVIADLSSVWVDLTVYQRDLDRVEVGHSVDVYVGHELETRGTISYVTPIVSEQTRTATARVVLPNKDGRWRPGMFVTARVIVSDATVPVAVTRTALHTFEGNTVVFVETEDGFAPRPVRIGRTDTNAAEVLEGLEVGERYISNGGFTLKAELGKEALGEGHAH